MSEATRGVILPAGETGSTFFHRILTSAVARFPDALGAARLPTDADHFRKGYGRALAAFEAARIASPERVAIARHMVTALHDGLGHAGPGAATSLAEHLATPHATPIAFARHRFGGRPGLRPAVHFAKKLHEGRALVGVVDDLHRQHHVTDAALNALRWLVEHAAATDGVLDLRGHRFALIGAGAELAPTAMLLQAGATVLWLDVVGPAGRLPPGLAGDLVVPSGVGDVLEDPRAVREAIVQFAEGQPVHLGLFAYAPGKGRELRLAGAMDAIARSLDPAIVASVAMFVSPTVPAEVQAEDVAHTSYRQEHLPTWQAALQKVGALVGPGHHVHRATSIAHAVVGLQGPTYQAAQYLAKMASAEVWATHGGRLDGAPRPVTTSANIAGIAATRSLVHPLFQAAFIGAASFGVRIFEPATTRTMAAMLVLHDLLNPASPSAAGSAFEAPAQKAQALARRQLHGGAYNLPWVFDTTIRAAAVLGLAKRPSLALALGRKRGRG
ncbi:MAG: hypothetical protein U1F43_33225 [Myxococcota bacterium]